MISRSIKWSEPGLSCTTHFSASKSLLLFWYRKIISIFPFFMDLHFYKSFASSIVVLQSRLFYSVLVSVGNLYQWIRFHASVRQLIRLKYWNFLQTEDTSYEIIFFPTSFWATKAQLVRNINSFSYQSSKRYSYMNNFHILVSPKVSLDQNALSLSACMIHLQ